MFFENSPILQSVTVGIFALFFSLLSLTGAAAPFA